jgi:malate dehydrogenase
MAFRVASGELLGKDQPVIIHLVDIPEMESRLEGVKMELDDCAFPTLVKTVTASKLSEGFKDIDIAFLVGSKPRTKGMERADLLKQNGKIFVDQGKALSDHAKRNVKVLVVGNPANTNCLIAMKNAKSLKPENFHAMTRLDHNRALAQLALKTNTPVQALSKLAIWGNHSGTMYADLYNTTVNGKKALDLVNREWYEGDFIPKVAQRGAEIIKARGASSAASAGNAAMDHVRDWILGTEDWVSMSVPTDGKTYDIPKDLIFSFPCTCDKGQYTIVQGLKHDAFALEKIKKTTDELLSERKEVENLL